MTRTRCAIRSRGCRCGCCARGFWTRQGINELERKVDEEVQRAADRALAAVLPTPDTILKHVYSEDLKPTDARFETKAAATADDDRADDGGPDQRDAA